MIILALSFIKHLIPLITSTAMLETTQPSPAHCLTHKRMYYRTILPPVGHNHTSLVYVCLLIWAVGELMCMAGQNGNVSTFILLHCQSNVSARTPRNISVLGWELCYLWGGGTAIIFHMMLNDEISNLQECSDWGACVRVRTLCL